MRPTLVPTLGRAAPLRRRPYAGTVDADHLHALVAELARKTGVCWLSYGYPPVRRPAWHVWHDDILLVVSAGTEDSAEQPLPGLPEDGPVAVTMRSKDTGGRLLTWIGAASRIRPADDDWAEAVAALAAQRLSLPSPSQTPVAWETTAVVTRIVPTDETLEEPHGLPDVSHAAAPAASAATTRRR